MELVDVFLQKLPSMHPATKQEKLDGDIANYKLVSTKFYMGKYGIDPVP